MKSKYNLNNEYCFLKAYHTTEYNLKEKKEVYLSILDKYYFQFFSKDLPQIFSDIFLGINNLTNAQKTKIWNSFLGNPLYFNVKTLDNTLILTTNSVFSINSGANDYQTNCSIYNVDFGSRFFYMPTLGIQCVYMEIEFYVDAQLASEFAYLGLTAGYKKLLQTDTFNWVDFNGNITQIKDYFTNNNHLSVLEYSTLNNAFGFIYQFANGTSINNTNVVRLPFELNFAQFQNKEELYKKSTGDLIKTSSQNEKIYKLKTEYLNESTHEAISTAFLHDKIIINGEKYVQKGGYEIKWIEEIGTEKKATAETKLYYTPYRNQSPNFIF